MRLIRARAAAGAGQVGFSLAHTARIVAAYAHPAVRDRCARTHARTRTHTHTHAQERVGGLVAGAVVGDSLCGAREAQSTRRRRRARGGGAEHEAAAQASLGAERDAALVSRGAGHKGAGEREREERER